MSLNIANKNSPFEMSYQHKQKGKIYVINRITTLAFRIPSTLARIRIGSTVVVGGGVTVVVGGGVTVVVGGGVTVVVGGGVVVPLVYSPVNGNIQETEIKKKPITYFITIKHVIEHRQ
jgi:hypothetical protein